MQKLIPFLLLAVLFSIGCSKDLSLAEQLAEDIQKIEQYLDDNNLTAQSTSSGLHYIIERPGTGANPDLESEVRVGYKGYFLDGEVFDQTASGQTVKFVLGGVIPGWQEGIQLFKRNGKGMLLIPSTLGYGRNPPRGIPANAVLLFDITLIDFE